jgi:hypothetical protein
MVYQNFQNYFVIGLYLQNHPREDFAMFSYKPYMEVQILKFLKIFWLQVLQPILKLSHF